MSEPMTLFERMELVARGAPQRIAYACICGARHESHVSDAPAVLACWSCRENTMQRRAS